MRLPGPGVNLAEPETIFSPETERAIGEWVAMHLENSPNWGPERWEEIGTILGVELSPR